MLRQKLFRLAAASWITAISILPAAAEQVAWQSDLEEAMTAARETNRPVLLHFWTPDCVPCRRLEKSVLNQPRVVETLERQFIPVKVNAQDHPEIARRYRVSSVPVDVVVTANNEELARMFTPQDPDRYVAQLSAIAISDGDTEVAEAAIQPRRRTARPSEIEVAATPTEEDTGKQPREADSVVASRADEEEVTERTTEKPVVVASTRNGRTKDTSAADEPEPREVINRFARQNHESDTDDAEPTAPARKQNWGRWPQGAQHESREVADSNGEEPASSDADVAEATDERTEARPARSAKSADHVAKSPASSKSQTMASMAIALSLWFKSRRGKRAMQGLALSIADVRTCSPDKRKRTRSTRIRMTSAPLCRESTRSSSLNRAKYSMANVSTEWSIKTVFISSPPKPIWTRSGKNQNAMLRESNKPCRRATSTNFAASSTTFE